MKQTIPELEGEAIRERSTGQNRNTAWNVFIIRYLIVLKVVDSLHGALVKIQKDQRVISTDAIRLSNELDRRLKDAEKAFKAYKQYMR